MIKNGFKVNMQFRHCTRHTVYKSEAVVAMDASASVDGAFRAAWALVTGGREEDGDSGDDSGDSASRHANR